MKKINHINLFFVSSDPMSIVSFFLPHLRALSHFGKIHVLANTSESNLLINRGLDTLIQKVPIKRPINFFYDLFALCILYFKFVKYRPNVVQTLTPKAGLLGMCAAWLARVPVRVHFFTGQVWITKKGPMRWLLKMADKCTALMSTNILVDSPSQRVFLIEQEIVTAERSRVLGAGSVCGVDKNRFYPNYLVRQAVRSELGTSSNALVCLYLGRLNKDKGVIDLACAFAEVAEINPQAELWLVGPDEGNCFQEMERMLRRVLPQVRRVGFTNEPERYMQAADLFCLPSYREGFGSAVIEAAACGVPALVSRIYGLSDAVKEGQTGWMHEAGNVKEITRHLNNLLTDPSELVYKGKEALLRTENFFEEKSLTNEMLEFYREILNETRI
jgi:glycosyltransferase involved in cell wall biosynthesis